MQPVLSVQHLRKRYGERFAVEGVSFDVQPGEVVGLLGPNGAGKSTLINMILGVLTPLDGSIRIEGIDPLRDRTRALAHTNFSAVYAPLPGNLTVEQNLRVFGMLYSVKALSARIEELLTQYDLLHLRKAKCGVLSSGEQSRVCLAKAAINHPTLLLLDEPTASLDPSKAEEIRLLVRKLATAKTGVLWTSHNMLEVEAVCDRVLFMSKGRILLQGNPKTLPGEHGKATLEELFIAVAREPLSLGKSHAA